MVKDALDAIEIYVSGGKWRPPPKADKLVDHHLSVVKNVVAEHPGHPLVLMGKSMGSRASCMVASSDGISASAVICLGYPLKGAKGVMRDEILLKLMVPTMFVQLDYGLMNAERDTPLTARLGEVEQVEVDENGKAWGPFLRARVVIDPTQPIMRCVFVYSKKKDTTILFDVMYERLPMFCFSCGLLGHSSLVCPTPADRDSEGKLPYRGDKLCVSERKRRDAGASNDQSQSSRNSRTGDEAGSGTQTSVPPKGQTSKADGQGEVISPLKKNPKGRKPIVPRKKTEKNNGKVVVTEDKDRVVGQKRKQKQVYRAINTTPGPVCTEGAGALVLVGDLLNPESTPVLSDVASDDSNKKQRTTSSRSADPTDAVQQPRQTQ
ncbi:hypothetical protein ZWY2020_012552 [Hordeum vulgare]|nr:hypothetical protein ZWY2020_012552 [Hordeum vulgare]